MWLRLYLVLCIIQSSLAILAQQKRAFMVGISHYDTSLTGYQWNNINGTEDIKLLYPIMQNQGFDITILLDEDATYEGITNKLNLFINKCTKGDIVYIHFSTHGQPVEDISGDEEDGWDEAIIPIDAYKIYKKGVYEGNKHLLDDLLNKYISRLRNKIGPKGFLYVVIDACHAGTSSRANDETIRGTRVGFTYNNKVFKPSTNKKSHYRIEHSNKQSDVMFIEACRPDQVNREIPIGDKRYGPLSYNIAQALSEYTLSLNANEFITYVKSSMMQKKNWPNNQNLVIETSY